MVITSGDVGQRLRPVLTSDEHAAGAARGELTERAGRVVLSGRKLSQVVQRRPPGVTGNQWNSATRTELDFVVCEVGSYTPVFAFVLADPAGRTTGAERGDRMTSAVCEAVGLELLRIESSTLRKAGYGRRIVEYVIDARAFRDALPDGADPLGADPAGAGPSGTDPTDGRGVESARLGYRDIVGRLPDGRRGAVNDLGAVARVIAVEAYVNGQVIDPIVRGLRVQWRDGAAEGWAWLRAREGRFLFERVRIWQHRFSCGVDPARLAEDLAVGAIGERLRLLEPEDLRRSTGPALLDGERLATDLERLRSRRGELAGPFAFDHVSFG
jgi:hypothetical protein